MRKLFGRKDDRKSDPLERALSVWRAESPPADCLRTEVRQRIVQAAFEANHTSAMPAPLFSPIPWRLTAGVLPVVLALVVAALYPDRTGDGIRRRSDLRVGRAGDEVVFTIANGSRGHTVYKSNDSSDFRNAERLSVSNGTFRDQVRDDAGLVFYRID